MRRGVIALVTLSLLSIPLVARDEPAPSGESVGPLSESEANRLAREIAPRVEEIRGQRFKRVVPVMVVDDARAREHFRARVDRYWPEDRIRMEQRVYADLGILPRGTDLLALLFDVLEEPERKIDRSCKNVFCLIFRYLTVSQDRDRVFDGF